MLLRSQAAAAIDLGQPAGHTAATRGTLLQRSIAGTDRQTDRHRTVTWSLPHTMMNAAYIQKYGPFHGRRQRVLMHITVRHANERLQQ